MRILLLGDYSSLHYNLKEGLVKLGHDAILASSGDGWKNIPRDIDFRSHMKGVPGRIHSRMLPLLNLEKFSNFDVVQLINPFLFYRFFPARFFFNTLKKNNESIYLSASGSDSFFWNVARNKMRYGPFDDHLKYDLQKKIDPLQSNRYQKFNEYIANNVDGIIPIMYEYEIGYKGFNNLRKTIPIPMNLEKIAYSENIATSKIVIFHGLNRYGFKGTRHIEKAFDILNRKYPHDVECIIAGKLPLNEYLELMKKTNIIIDQTNSYSLGVNGIYGLAMGKIVMGGAEPESLLSFGINSSPVINIEPNYIDIINKVEYLLEQRSNFLELGLLSRIYCEKIHDYVKVANQYLKQWDKYNL